MKCGILSVQRNKFWVIKAVDRRTRRTVAWVLGGRDTATFRRLYDKVRHLTNCTFFIPTIGRPLLKSCRLNGMSSAKRTITIEHDNSNTCHHLGRLTRHTKVVSKKEFMVDLSLRIWHTVTTTNRFSLLQEKILSLFR
jgi:insertion element IS1 protein InsB